MSSLTQAIKFRSLASQLTDTEFTTFVKEVISQYDRSIILTPIFNQFSQHIPASPNQQMLDELIAIIKRIMTQRNPATKPGIVSDPKPVTMLSLSSALIGEIGSLLDQKSHMRFSRCSRDIYIGCECPCTLRSLSLLGTDTYDRVDFRRYAQIRSLQLDVNQFPQLQLPSTGIVCRSLSALTLRNGDGQHNPDLTSLLQCTAIDFTNITALGLENFPSKQRRQSGQHFPVESLLNLLSLFPNLQFLYFDVVSTEPLNSGQLVRMKKMLPNLHVFRERGLSSATTTGIISAFSGSLRSMGCGTWRIPHHPIGQWSSMEEVHLAADGGIQPLMLEIISSSAKLKRVCLFTEICESSTLKAVMNDIIVRTGGLEKLSLDMRWTQMPLICDAIDRALFDIADRERKRLQINMQMRWDTKPKSRDLAYRLLRVLNQLASTKIENFLLEFRTTSRVQQQQYWPDPAEWQEQLQRFKRQQGHRFDIAFSEHIIMISNKNFDFNGREFQSIQDKWLRRLE